jgi:cold shock CspA family protein
MSSSPIITIDRMHRLRPSDIYLISTAIKEKKLRHEVFSVFVEYLGSLIKPSSVEIDDVVRVSSQLASAGVWKKIKPEFVLEMIDGVVDDSVARAFRDAVGISEPEIRESVLLESDLEFVEIVDQESSGRLKKPVRDIAAKRLSAKQRKHSAKIGVVTWFNPKNGYALIHRVDGKRDMIVKVAGFGEFSIKGSKQVQILREGQTLSFRVVNEKRRAAEVKKRVVQNYQRLTRHHEW